MRFGSTATNAALLVIGSLLGRTAVAAPNHEVSKTSLSIDRHRQALDNGEIVVRVQRTDDLFSDATDNEDARLLLEKNTHIALRIKLDSTAGTVNVNDETLDLSSDETKVTAVRAEALRLPHGHHSPVLDADTIISLLEEMSPGIVGIEVKVESQPVAPSVSISSTDDAVVSSGAEALTVRKVGLWIRITEIEGKAVPHTTTTYTPILQLIVMGSGNKVQKIETLSINGKAPLDEVLSVPGNAMLPEDVSHAITSEEPFGRSDRPYKHHHKGHMHERPGFLSWLTGLLGLKQEGRFFGRGQGRPCFKKAGEAARARGAADAMAIKAGRPIKYIETHRPLRDNPFSDSEAAPHDRPAHRFGGHHMHPHAHRHQHHGPCRRFFSRIAIGFVYGLALVGTFVLHPYTLFGLGCILLSAITFHAVRRMVIKKRNSRIPLEEKDENEPLNEKEKLVLLSEVVVVEERKSEDLPLYEERTVV